MVSGLLKLTWMGLAISLLLVAGSRVGLTAPGVLSSAEWLGDQGFSSRRSDLTSSLQNVLVGVTHWVNSARKS